ncbi:MAG: T9SS type A sorting domain-containing protein [Sphingobacteriaceae bacterium]|nr:T9SS type A sorting domain-containing protein [Sphingobacteriaceae bacterium]
MIKKLLFSTMVFCGLMVSAQSFSGMYHFSSVMSGTANTGTLDPTPTPTANGLTFGAFSAVGTPSTVSASGVFAFNTWDLGATNGDNITFTGSINPGKYFEVTLTPAANSTISFSDIKFNMSRSSTGPRHWAVRGSLDTYSTNLTATIAPTNSNISVQAGDNFFWNLDSYTVTGGAQEVGSTILLGSTSYSNVTNAVSFRFYPWNAEGNAGTFRLDTVIFNGSANMQVGLNKLTTKLNSGFTVYPNPSNEGVIHIDAKANYSKIEVINILGSVVAKQELTEAEKLTLNLNNLPAGTYFIRAYTHESAILTEKIILNK